MAHTIKATRYAKNGITTTLEYGFGGGSYYVRLDDVVLCRRPAYWQVPWAKGQEAEAALAETGWVKA